jgi:uncharacterized protein YodC (DUF2158 family)
MSSDNTFKVGEIVELKSGGPPMTIVEVNTNLLGDCEIKCQWFFVKMESGSFTPDVLARSKPRNFEELKGAYASPALEATSSPKQN